MLKSLILKRDIHKIEKKNSISISAFGSENKEKYPIHVSRKCCEEKHADLLIEKEKDIMFLPKILMRFCRTILYIVEQKPFLLLLFTSFQYRKKYSDVILKAALN